MKLTRILMALLFFVLSAAKVSAAPTIGCFAKTNLHSINLTGGGISWPHGRFNFDVSNFHHEYSHGSDGGPHSLHRWYDGTEYRELLIAGERYIEAVDTMLYFALELRTLSIGTLDGDDPEHFVGYYEIQVRKGGYGFTDGARDIEFYGVVNVDAEDVLNIRAEPNSASRKVGEIPYYGYGVIVLSEKPVQGWVFVNFGGVEGWVSERYLARGSRPKDYEFKGLIECEYGY